MEVVLLETELFDPGEEQEHKVGGFYRGFVGGGERF